MASALNITFPGNLAQVGSVDDLRAVPTAFVINQAAYLAGEFGLFTFQAGSLAGDDGLTVIKPNDRSVIQAGRWELLGSGSFATANALAQAVSPLINQAALQSAKLANTVYITDPPYNAKGDGTDDTTAIMAAINANKGGMIIFPAGKVFAGALILLSGATYNGTTIVIEGTYKLLANPNPAGANFQNAMYAGIVFQNVDGCRLSVPGVMDGNRLNQPASQQHHLVVFAGATNCSVDDGWTVREVRGDGFVTLKNIFADPNSKNCNGITIGNGVGINTADDGRNLVSVISGENVTVGNCTSRKIGGIIAGERMPGGFDCEPDHNAGHLVRNLTVGFWTIETIGTSGYAFIGASQSGTDANRDWNIVNVRYAGAIVNHTDTTGLIGGPIVRRVSRISGGNIQFQRQSRNAGVDLDYLDFADLSFTIGGVSQGCSIGFTDFVYDSTITIAVTDFSAAALLAGGIGRSEVSVTARMPQGAGSYGINFVAPNGRTITQTGVRYTINCPYDNNLSLAMRGGGVTFGLGTAVVGGVLLGYPNNVAQFASIDAKVIPTANVYGRNFAASPPTTGTWARSDIVSNDTASAGGPPSWVNVTSGVPSFKANAALAA